MLKTDTVWISAIALAMFAAALRCPAFAGCDDAAFRH